MSIVMVELTSQGLQHAISGNLLQKGTQHICTSKDKDNGPWTIVYFQKLCTIPSHTELHDLSVSSLVLRNFDTLSIYSIYSI